MRERPEVDLHVAIPPSEALVRLEKGLVECVDCVGHVGRAEASFLLSEKHRHVFSPYLSLEVRPEGEGSRLKGRFGPEPHLWTLFVAIYASFCVMLLAGSVYGSVQVALGLGHEGLYVCAAALAGLAGSCSVDLVGRARGASQMAHIRGFLTDTFPDAREEEPG
ncbi:MAG: hypothetical protein EP330_17365 [Deltaproteobacteria bacterium]|nr:MAG: hypothetical protein EP330_17365 [Deltaproteobacteria bacterium]